MAAGRAEGHSRPVSSAADSFTPDAGPPLQPRASRERVLGLRGEAFAIALKAPPVDGAANEELEALRDAYFLQVEMGNNDGKWDWRKQAYIAWSCVPKAKRWPKTEQEFASLIGLSNTATIRKWKLNDPEIGERIATLPKALLANHVADVLEAMVTVASDPIPQATAERKLFLEVAGIYNPKGSLDIKGLVTVEMDEVLDDEEQAAVEAMMRGLAAGKV